MKLPKCGNSTQLFLKFCKQLYATMPPSNQDPRIGDVIAVVTIVDGKKNYINSATKCDKTENLDVVWLGIRVR